MHDTIPVAAGKVADALQRLPEQLEDLQDSARHKVNAAVRTTDRVVHRHPYGALGIAVAAGLIVGLLAGRR